MTIAKNRLVCYSIAMRRERRERIPVIAHADLDSQLPRYSPSKNTSFANYLTEGKKCRIYYNPDSGTDAGLETVYLHPFMRDPLTPEGRTSDLYIDIFSNYSRCVLVPKSGCEDPDGEYIADFLENVKPLYLEIQRQSLNEHNLRIQGGITTDIGPIISPETPIIGALPRALEKRRLKRNQQRHHELLEVLERYVGNPNNVIRHFSSRFEPEIFDEVARSLDPDRPIGVDTHIGTMQFPAGQILPTLIRRSDDDINETGSNITNLNIKGLLQKFGERAMPAIRTYLIRLTDAEQRLDTLEQEITALRAIIENQNENQTQLGRELKNIELKAKLQILSNLYSEICYEILLPLKAVPSAMAVIDELEKEEQIHLSAIQGVRDQSDAMLDSQLETKRRIQNAIQELNDPETEPSEVRDELTVFANYILSVYQLLEFTFQRSKTDDKGRKTEFVSPFDDNSPINNPAIIDAITIAIKYIDNIPRANVDLLVVKEDIRGIKEMLRTVFEDNLTDEQLAMIPLDAKVEIND